MSINSVRQSLTAVFTPVVSGASATAIGGPGSGSAPSAANIAASFAKYSGFTPQGSTAYFANAEDPAPKPEEKPEGEKPAEGDKPEGDKPDVPPPPSKPPTGSAGKCVPPRIC